MVEDKQACELVWSARSEYDNRDRAAVAAAAAAAEITITTTNTSKTNTDSTATDSFNSNYDRSSSLVQLPSSVRSASGSGGGNSRAAVIARRLVDFALKKGTRDNVTVVLVELDWGS
jgi:hypothetical protein